MTRKTEGELLPQCRFYVYEGPRPICLKLEFTASKCPECEGSKIYRRMWRGHHVETTPCPDCLGTGLGEKPVPGEICHERRPDCLAYEQTTRFSCGGGGD